MHRFARRFLATFIVSVAALALAASAWATTAVRTGSTTGPLVPSSGVLTAPLASGTSMSFSWGNMSCAAGNIGLSIGTNPGATSVSATPTAFNGSSCTETIPSITYGNISLLSAAAGTISSVSSGGTVVVNLVFSWATDVGPCNYQLTNAPATYSNSTAQLVFSNVSVARASGSTFGCASSMTMSATFGPMTYNGSNVYVANA